MDLWIRSQDKEKLVKCNDIAIATDSKDGEAIRGYKIVGYFDKQTEYENLGIYAKKERALEVLDEIQQILKPKMIMNVSPSNEMIELRGGRNFGTTKAQKQNIDMEFKELSTYVYVMPKE